MSYEAYDNMNLNSHDQLRFFVCDTTLRDGEQVNGVNYSPEQKLEIAVLLDKMGVESIDAGFAATSKKERDAIRLISEANLNMRIMSMCRVVKEDIDYALSCGVDGVILFIPGSDTHIKAKFGPDIMKEREKIVEKALNSIKYAKDKGLFVEFGVEDSSRTNIDIVLEILSKAEEAGADLLGTTDTVGWMTPERTYAFIKKLVDNLNRPVGIHCHNDLGLATANTVAGLLAGAGYCSPTVNGIGERAGNASLEEVIMILKVLYGQNLKYDTKVVSELSSIVERYSSVKMDILKPVIGRNAYTHESGIHIHGMLKDKNTYEIFDPGMVGKSREYIIGKHAGKNTIQYFLAKHGYEVSLEETGEFWNTLKDRDCNNASFTENDVIKFYKEYTEK